MQKCWNVDKRHGKHCTLSRGHKGPCRVTLHLYSYFGKGACEMCGGINVYETSTGYNCDDCGYRGCW